MVMLMYFTFSGSDAEDIDIEHWLVNETNLKHLKAHVQFIFDVISFLFNGIIKQNI